MNKSLNKEYRRFWTGVQPYQSPNLHSKALKCGEELWRVQKVVHVQRYDQLWSAWLVVHEVSFHDPVSSIKSSTRTWRELTSTLTGRICICFKSWLIEYILIMKDAHTFRSRRLSNKKPCCLLWYNYQFGGCFLWEAQKTWSYLWNTRSKITRPHQTVQNLAQSWYCH